MQPGETASEKFTAELAAQLGQMRVVPGNEAGRVAKKLVDWMYSNDRVKLEDVQKQVEKDELDVEEVSKDIKAIMQAIVAMSKMLENTNNSIKDVVTILQTRSGHDTKGGEDSPTN